MDVKRGTERPLYRRSHTVEVYEDKLKHAGKLHQLIPRSADRIYFHTNKKEMKKYVISCEYGPRDLDEINHIHRRLHNIAKKLPKQAKVEQALDDPEFRFCIIANDEYSATTCAEAIFECTPTMHGSYGSILSKDNDYGYLVTIADIRRTQDKFEDLINEHIINETLRIGTIPEEYRFAFTDEDVLQSKQKSSILRECIPLSHFLSVKRTSCLYDACQKFLLKCIDSIEKIPKEEKDSNLFDRLEILKRRLNREDQICRTLSTKCIDLVKKGAKLGVVGHVLSVGVLTLYIENKATDLKPLIKNIKENFDGKIEEIFIDKSFLKGYSNIMPGGEIISPKGSGTLGMFGHLDGSPVAVTGGHVIEKGQLAQVHIDNILTRLGTCIWPDVTESQTNISDIAVIKMDGNILDRISYQIRDKVIIYTENLLELRNREVFKYGATTHLTRGYIEDIDSMSLFDSTDVALVAHKNDDENFAQEGDSGAIVLTKLQNKHFAIGVVYGGGLNPRNSPKTVSPKTSVIVSLNHAIQRFKEGYENCQVLNLDSV